MASFVLPTTTRNDLANKINDDVDGGQLKIYAGAAPGPNNPPGGTLLATLNLPAKAQNTVANGVLTFGAIDSAAAVDDGEASFFRLLKADGTTVVAEGDVATQNATLNLATVNVAAGVAIAITSLTVTAPAGT